MSNGEINRGVRLMRYFLYFSYISIPISTQKIIILLYFRAHTIDSANVNDAVANIFDVNLQLQLPIINDGVTRKYNRISAETVSLYLFIIINCI